MNIVDRARELASNALGQGRHRIDRMRSDRQRSKLLLELGESCYAKSKGDTASAAAVERIIGEIDDLADDDAGAQDANEGSDDESDVPASVTT